MGSVKQRIRGYDPAANGIAERWVGIIKVRATCWPSIGLPPDYWAYACKWVACVHNHRVLSIRLNARGLQFVWRCGRSAQASEETAQFRRSWKHRVLGHSVLCGLVHC